MSEKLDAKKTAMLVMDYQLDIVNNYAQNLPELLERASGNLALARTAGCKVMYIVISFRDGYPEIGVRNKNFQMVKSTGRFLNGSPGAEIHPQVAPQAGDLVIAKKRVSAFAGSDLDLLLRTHGIENLILFGISTSGVVLSTVRQAADLDYQLFVIKDCCSDQDAEVHKILTEKVFVRQAEVIGSNDILGLL